MCKQTITKKGCSTTILRMLYNNKLYPFQHNAWQWMESESHSFITTKLFFIYFSSILWRKWKKNKRSERIFRSQFLSRNTNTYKSVSHWYTSKRGNWRKEGNFFSSSESVIHNSYFQMVAKNIQSIVCCIREVRK